jgi:hypothetical protein
MERIEAAGAGFRSLTEAIDTTTAAGRMMMQMVGSFAEFERAMIRERTSAGLAQARRRADRRTPAQTRRKATARDRGVRHLRTKIRRRDGAALSCQRADRFAHRRRAPTDYGATGMKRGHDLTGLMKFATRPEWADDLHDALDDHLGPVLTQFDIDSDELPGIIGDHWAMTLWGCAFEDLVTRVFEPDGRNIVDEYLKRRGWNEAGPNKLYMRALKTSVMSVYEVSAIEPGVGFLARDLIRGGDPVQVRERTASRTLGPWDRIGVRIIPVSGHRILAGGLLSLQRKPPAPFSRHCAWDRASAARARTSDRR